MSGQVYIVMVRNVNTGKLNIWSTHHELLAAIRHFVHTESGLDWVYENGCNKDFEAVLCEGSVSDDGFPCITKLIRSYGYNDYRAQNGFRETESV